MSFHAKQNNRLDTLWDQTKRLHYTLKSESSCRFWPFCFLLKRTASSDTMFPRPLGYCSVAITGRSKILAACSNLCATTTTLEKYFISKDGIFLEYHIGRMRCFVLISQQIYEPFNPKIKNGVIVSKNLIVFIQRNTGK